MKKSFIYVGAIIALTLAACSSQNDPTAPNVTIINNNATATAETGLLPGIFSVAPGHTVQFAKGNLQCSATASGSTWRFADEQYNYWGFDNKATNNNRDLYGFGQTGYGNTFLYVTSGTFSTDKKYWGGYWQNSSTSYGYGDIYLTNWDWGMYCAIENGGGHPGLWRTLQENEWNYLLKTRPNAEYLHGFAQVAEKRGYMILPDNWVAPAGLTFNYQATNYSDNEYCYQDWKKMEAAGAVFLPCTGCYDMNSTSAYVYFPESCGYYWTSDIASNSTYGRAVHFGYLFTTNSSITSPGSTNYTMTLRDVYKYYGCAVRLVREAQ